MGEGAANREDWLQFLASRKRSGSLEQQSPRGVCTSPARTSHLRETPDGARSAAGRSEGAFRGTQLNATPAVRASSTEHHARPGAVAEHPPAHHIDLETKRASVLRRLRGAGEGFVSASLVKPPTSSAPCTPVLCGKLFARPVVTQSVHYGLVAVPLLGRPLAGPNPSIP
jgi:hypothetical protein